MSIASDIQRARAYLIEKKGKAYVEALDRFEREVNEVANGHGSFSSYLHALHEYKDLFARYGDEHGLTPPEELEGEVELAGAIISAWWAGYHEHF